MLVDSDCGLNLMPGFDIYLQSGTMINQQEIFRNQIYSLGSFQNHCLKEHKKLSLDLNLAATHYSNDDTTLLGNSYSPEVSALTENDSFDWIPEDCRANPSGRNHFYQEVEHREVSCNNNKLVRRTLFTSSPQIEELDLNKPPPNEYDKFNNPNSIRDNVLSNKTNGQCLIDTPSEVNTRAKNGAVSLLYLSSQSLTKNQDLPQMSSESYESIVLKQEDCSINDYCVSSTPFEETGLGKNEHGMKLKRGRRMKDFRKEILPGLGSLSRKEINEDIKIMDVALRSREYKKYRATIGGKNECVARVRSRRS